MNLVVDIGNSYTKLGIFEGAELKETTSAENDISEETITAFTEDHSIEKALLCTVQKDQSIVVRYLQDNYEFIIFGNDTPVPVENLYKTPDTLGLDRLALGVSISNTFPGKNVLSIDFGTCVTFDFVNSSKQYLGGSIAPGLQMRLKALHTFTDNLPLIEPEDVPELIGHNTETSILSGVINGMVAGVDAMIIKYKKQYPGLLVVLTGGDCDFFDKALKNSNFADPYLLLKGLNIILNYNAHSV